jgi:hypothetical protein
MNPKKFLVLYMGPFGLDTTRAPITQSSLDQWAQQIGTALIDRGTLLTPFARSVFSDGRSLPADFPVHGYSIVQAQDTASAVSLVKTHPFLANDRDGNYEIEVMELTDEDIPPDAIDTAPIETIMGVPVSTLDAMMDQAQAKVQASPSAESPVAQNPGGAEQSSTNPNDGELNIAHDGPQPGQTIVPPSPPDDRPQN